MGLPIFTKEQVSDSPGSGVRKVPHDMAEHQMSGTDTPHTLERDMVSVNLKDVKRVIGVHSGKGGVGKTFIAVNIAFALAARGLRVGLLDADIDCPNIARFLNLRDMALTGTKQGRIAPLEYGGIKLVSTHFLSDMPHEPMIVRGPIKHKVLAELLTHVDWGALDVLVYDLPPGTSDVPMSTMLIGNLSGMIVVTTPQKESVMDARKSASMARNLGVPLLGVVENMSGEVFGIGGGKRLAAELDAPFLGTIPLSAKIRALNEEGKMAFLHPEFTQPDVVNAALGEPLFSSSAKDEAPAKRKFFHKLLNR